jgi:hypothetical protein
MLAPPQTYSVWPVTKPAGRIAEEQKRVGHIFRLAEAANGNAVGKSGLAGAALFDNAPKIIRLDRAGCDDIYRDAKGRQF